MSFIWKRDAAGSFVGLGLFSLFERKDQALYMCCFMGAVVVSLGERGSLSTGQRTAGAGGLFHGSLRCLKIITFLGKSWTLTGYRKGFQGHLNLRVKRTQRDIWGVYVFMQTVLSNNILKCLCHFHKGETRLTVEIFHRTGNHPVTVWSHSWTTKFHTDIGWSSIFVISDYHWLQQGKEYETPHTHAWHTVSPQLICVELNLLN